MASQSIRVIAPNQTELITTKGAVKRTIFFSYETPVVIKYTYNHGLPKEYKGEDVFEVFVTSKKYSVTTSKHINKYLESVPIDAAAIQPLSQGEIYRLTDVMSREEVRQ
jgi:hypothetical protein